MSNKQGDQRKHGLLEKIYLIKGKWIHYEHPEISIQLIDSAMKQSIHEFLKKKIDISKCLVEDNKKKNEYS